MENLRQGKPMQKKLNPTLSLYQKILKEEQDKCLDLPLFVEECKITFGRDFFQNKSHTSYFLEKRQFVNNILASCKYGVTLISRQYEPKSTHHTIINSLQRFQEYLEVEPDYAVRYQEFRNSLKSIK